MMEEFITKIAKVVKETDELNSADGVHIDIKLDNGNLISAAVKCSGKKKSKGKLISETDKLQDQLECVVKHMGAYSKQKELAFEMCAMDDTKSKEDNDMEPKGKNSLVDEIETIGKRLAIPDDEGVSGGCDNCEPCAEDEDWPESYTDMITEIYEHFDDELADMDAGISEIIEEIKHLRRTNIVLQTKKKHIESLTFAIENLEERLDEIKDTIEDVSPAWLSEETDKRLKAIEDKVARINNAIQGALHSQTQDQLITNMSQVLKDIYGKIQDNENAITGMQKMITDIYGKFNEMYDDYLTEKKEHDEYPVLPDAKPEQSTVKTPAKRPSRSTKKAAPKQ